MSRRTDETARSVGPTIGLLCGDGAEGCGEKIDAIASSLRPRHLRIFTRNSGLLSRHRSSTCLVVEILSEDDRAIDDWLESDEATLLVVDGAPAVAQRAIDRGVPTIIFRRHGHFDEAYHNLLRDAGSLIADFTRNLEQEETPEWVREKTLYSGALVRGERLFVSPSAAEGALLDVIRRRRASDGSPIVVVAPDRQSSEESSPIPIEELRRAATMCADWQWVVLRRPDPPGTEPTGPDIDETIVGNLHVLPEPEHPWTFYRHADVVISDARSSVLADVAASGSRLICIPEAVPYDEQIGRAHV